MIVELKTVARAIDATGFENKGKSVAIRYVKEDGEIRDMLVSKAIRPKRRRTGDGATRALFVNTNYKEKALIKIMDHTDSARYKTVFLFGIIAFNPAGNLQGPWATIKRGT